MTDLETLCAQFLVSAEDHPPAEVQAEVINLLGFMLDEQAEKQECPDCARLELFQAAVAMLAGSLGFAMVDGEGEPWDEQEAVH